MSQVYKCLRPCVEGRGRYQIISGETRVLAARSLRWKTIRAIVRELSDAEALKVMAIANAQRKDLTATQKKPNCSRTW